MTEPLTLVVVTVALLMLARALEEPSSWRYGVFVAWTTAAAAVRLQALVILPAFVVAAVIDALAARDRRRLRPLVGLGAVAVLVVVLVSAGVVATGGELTRRSILGAYTPVGESAPVAGEGLGEIVWHAFDVAVLGLGLPALAFAALGSVVFTRRDADPRLRAFVSTGLAYAALLVVQVGLFSSVYVGAVAERYLLTVLPLLAIALCTWIARGAPAERRVVVPAWAVLVLLAAIVPLDQLVGPGSIVNTLTPAPLSALGSETAQRVGLVLAALAAGALAVLLPRRLAWIGAVVVGVGLGLVSVDTARRIEDASAHEQRATSGSAAPAWLDDAGLHGATMLVTGDRVWTSVARTVFWNRSVREVLSLPPVEVPFPPDVRAATVGDDGVLRSADGASSRPPADRRAGLDDDRRHPSRGAAAGRRRRAGARGLAAAGARSDRAPAERVLAQWRLHPAGPGHRVRLPPRHARRHDPREDRRPCSRIGRRDPGRDAADARGRVGNPPDPDAAVRRRDPRLRLPARYGRLRRHDDDRLRAEVEPLWLSRRADRPAR